MNEKQLKKLEELEETLTKISFKNDIFYSENYELIENICAGMKEIITYYKVNKDTNKKLRERRIKNE